ncbi:MAG TPA: type I restriction endonuclease subunit R [Smithella sp.]|jgi:type I restriction enzyme R subunit|nr:type I restriction endonuclease subunit R [Smithellaceae bacterium]HPC08733.1 type I restriction endonuclease subunit R [Smithella sp.]HPN87286.1 type I restriction endonuclease subunit R [Smithella sp.]HPV72277.1 type I restriction endonuclease subunit R [Smithellaceae bacterium]HQN70978.1 type I restriction endonuclease subunit R [Smithella sp.]
MPNFISEDQIEKAAVALLTNTYGYRTINCFTQEMEDLADRSNRASKQEVVLLDVLKAYAVKLNRDIPEDVIEEALDKLTSRRYAMSPLLANKEVYVLMRDGIPVQYKDQNGKTEHGTVRVIDFAKPQNNDFCAVTQLWIKGERYPRRPDILIYVNGLPLVFIELKNSNVKVQNAYDDNLTNYKKDIPLLFQYNAFCVLSNARETRVGSFTVGYEFFFSWLRADDETEKINRKTIEQEASSLERVLSGLLPKDRLLDYIENFILYHRDTQKIVAQNHQFLGVNKAIASFERRAGKNGKLGVFWHTQGSGKSFSMIFLARKVFHKYPGNYTFVIVTDRDDLDGQIYRNFLDTNTVSKNEAARPGNSKEMREFLGRNKRLVFTLIQKFRFEKGKEYPLLSDRNDIIVIVDEAHRTQYKDLAENMRKGIPNAQYFAFTGTPLLGRERKTNAWFGDYVSEYNFIQSVDDGATVPLFYQKRVPEVLIQNDNLSDEFYSILEDENLDDKAQQKLEREFSTELEVIKRDDRLETIARDIAAHFPQRGYLGKGMVISVDKFTCVKMYDKVQIHWKVEIKRLVGVIGKIADGPYKERCKKQLDFMRSVEMAVVVSEDAGEEERFAKQKLDIKPHRKKMNAIDENGHDIEYRFKAPDDKLQLVFVCAMWLTGFDAPTVSTLYLDKPMKDHTLMQTIARANRVTSHTINGISKANGEVVDYYNVFRNMKKALSDYAMGDEQDETPVQDKTQLFHLLGDALQQGLEFCQTLEVDLNKVLDAQDTFKRVNLFTAFADKLLEKDDHWKEFKVYENTISALYEACKPEILKKRFNPAIAAFQYLRGVVESVIGQADIEAVKQKIGELLDQSIVTSNPELFAQSAQPQYAVIKKGKTLDLSTINFEKLKEEFHEKEFKHIEIANLRDFIEKKLEVMLKENSTRTDFAQKLQEIINRYNAGGTATENYYDDLLKYAESLKEEDERHIREGLTQDELELYDILKKDKMTKAEEIKVKNAARHLLQRLIKGRPKVLIQDWYKDGQSQHRVKSAIEEVLDKDLPDTYEKDLFKEKSGKLYDLVYEYASKGQKWAA